MMNLKVLSPTQLLLKETVTKINAEAENGAFGLLPNHIDFVAALLPGILSFEFQQGQEAFVGGDEGILVKCGFQVLVSVRDAIYRSDLETLQQTVEEKFKQLDEQDKLARSAIVKLETSFIRGFLEM